MGKQRLNETDDKLLCDLDDLTRKCEFATDCCANCQLTRILGQVVYGLYYNEILRKVLEQVATLTPDQAEDILRLAKAASKSGEK